MNVHEIELQQLPERLRRVVVEQAERVGVRVTAQAAIFLARTNTRLSPVGRPRTMTTDEGVRLPRNDTPGELRASWRTSAGSPQFAGLPDAPYYPPAGDADFVPPLRRLKVGEPAFVTNDAAEERQDESYATIVAVLGRTVDRNGRAIGSLQAPDGTVRPAVAALVSSWSSMVLRVLDGIAAQGGY